MTEQTKLEIMIEKIKPDLRVACALEQEHNLLKQFANEIVKEITKKCTCEWDDCKNRAKAMGIEI